MAQEIPQYSDLTLEFSDVIYTDNEGNEINLETATDIILSIAKGSANNAPMLVLKNSTDSDRFTIDNSAKTVVVSITAEEISQQIGTYYMNLWVVLNDTHRTHAVKYFTVIPSVKYEV